jgi:hypothetical protein
MTKCNNWFCDGTFSSAPTLFYQVYTIHTVQYSNVLPSVYILLSDKKEKTYRCMFQALKSITTGLCLKTIMVDFVKAAMNAINYEFPKTKVKGCFFHFSQCIWRQVQDVDLQTRYKDDVTFALQVRKLPSLAYVPKNEVINAYNNLLETTYFTEHDKLLSPILNYFEETWIGCMDRRKKST